MNSSPSSQRVERLLHECEVSVVPALLLLAACGVFTLLLVLHALQADPAIAPAHAPAHAPAQAPESALSTPAA